MNIRCVQKNAAGNVTNCQPKVCHQEKRKSRIALQQMKPDTTLFVCQVPLCVQQL